MLLIFLAFLLSVNSHAADEVKDTAPPIPPAPSVLIAGDNQKCDEDFNACVLRSSQGRVANLMQLHLAQLRVQDRFNALQERVQAIPDMKPEAYDALLETLWKEVDQDLKSLAQNLKGSSEIKKLADAEMKRLRAETATRLALASMGVASSEKRQELIGKYSDMGQLWSERALQTLEEVSSRRREILAPRLLGRIAMTRISVEQIRMHQRGASETQAFDAFDDIIKKHITHPDSLQESTWLKMVWAESMLSLASHSIGSVASRVSLDPEKSRAIRDMGRKLEELSQRIQDPVLKGKARELALEIPFFVSGEVERQEHLDSMKQQIRSTQDPKEARFLRNTLADVAIHNSGTALGHQIIQMGSQDKALAEILEPIRLTHEEQGRAYNQAYKEAVGESTYERLGFASFDQVMKSRGFLQNLHDEYASALVNFGNAFEAHKKDPKKTDKDTVLKQMTAADLYWARIQCHRFQMNSPSKPAPRPNGRRAHSPQVPSTEVKAPFGSFTIDLKHCRADSYDPIQANKAAYRMLQNAIESDTRQKIAWMAGEFAFDVATVIASGGAVALFKAPLKAGIKKVGTSALKSKALNAATVKGLTRGASFTSQALAVDLAGQSVKATRSFIQEGLQGNWDVKNFTDNFSYTSSKVTTDQHVLRILASGVASRGLEMLWHRVPKINNTAIQQQSHVTQFGVGVAQTTVNTVIGKQISPIVDASLGKRDLSVQAVAGTLLSPDEWISALEAALRSKAGGALVGRVSGTETTRYLGKGFIQAVMNFNLSEADIAQLEKLESCLTRIKPSGLVTVAPMVQPENSDLKTEESQNTHAPQ